MHKIKYLFVRIIHLDYKNMFKIAGVIHKKSGKSRLWILIDMILCGFRYQAGYYDYLEFEFYNMDKAMRETYITRGINNEIVRKYNDKNYFYKFDNKIEFNKIFKDFLKRDYLLLEDYDSFLKFVSKKKEIIVKPIDGEGGVDVEKISILSNTNLKKLYKSLKEKKQLLLEDVIVQHQVMSKLYPDSVNTLRMFTFYHNKKTVFLYAVLKIGNGGVTDNFSSGGMYTFLDSTGKVMIGAIDKEDHIYGIHPKTKSQIIGFQVPMFEDAVNLVKEASKKVKEVGYVGWDVAITRDGPVLVEGNCFPGVFQMKASLNPLKEGMLPTYKKYMDL